MRLARVLVLLVTSLLAQASTEAWAKKAETASPFQKSAALFLLKCSKCHTVGGGRRVGPDLRGVAERHPKDWIVGFVMDPDGYLSSDPAAKKLLSENNGVRMENTHLTRDQAEGLLEFIKAASSGPASEDAGARQPQEEPLALKLRMPDEGLTFSRPGLAAMLLLLALATVLWRLNHGAAGAVFLLALAAAYWTFGGRRYYHLLGNQQGYEPEQPIAFSHALHAGKLQISCLYCHSGAERSDVAGVPALNVCMNCHVAVKAVEGAKEPSVEIRKLEDAWKTRATAAPRLVEWTRVHHLPDYVHFSHRLHVADEIQCQECHGPVQTMTRLRQAAPLSMGWCLRCHRETAGTAPSHWKRSGGPLDCAACHW